MMDDELYECPSCHFTMMRNEITFLEPNWEAHCTDCGASMSSLVPNLTAEEIAEMDED